MEPTGTEFMEMALESLGNEMHRHFINKEYAAAKRTLQAMRNMTNGCKIRLLGILIKTSPGAGTKVGLETMERNAAKAIELVYKKESYTARSASLAMVFGKRAVSKFTGPLAAILIVKDVFDATDWAAGKLAERAVAVRIAQYGDYLDGFALGNAGDAKTYREWMGEIYLPGQQRKNSEFWRYMRMIAPGGIQA